MHAAPIKTPIAIRNALLLFSTPNSHLDIAKPEKIGQM